MAATYFDPEYLRSLGTYIQTSSPQSTYAGNIPTAGGRTTTTSGGMLGLGDNYLGNTTRNVAAASLFGGPLTAAAGAIPGVGDAISGFVGDLPLVGDIFGKIFGGEQTSGFSPYINKQGNYVWTNPNTANPVPVASVPGATLKPSGTQRKLYQNVQGLQNVMPYITEMMNQATAQGTMSSAMADLAATQKTSPAYAQLMVDLYNQYGPQLNAIGNAILEQNMLANQASINKVLAGPGAETVTRAVGLQKETDPEFYASRALASGRLGDLLNSIDLSGGLSETERREIEQGLARNQLQSGIYNAPSQLAAVERGMKYGQAGYQRKQQAISNLSTALSKASEFLPASKSGIDAFQVATGKSSMVNPGAGLFNTAAGAGLSSGGAGTSASNYGLAGNILGNMNAMNIAAMNNATQERLNRKDWADYLNQVTSSIGNIVGAAKGSASKGLI